MREASRNELIDVEKARQERVWRSQELMREWEGVHWRVVSEKPPRSEKEQTIQLRDGSWFVHDPVFVWGNIMRWESEEAGSNINMEFFRRFAPEMEQIGVCTDGTNFGTVLAQPHITTLGLPLLSGVALEDRAHLRIGNYTASIRPVPFGDVGALVESLDKLVSVGMSRVQGEADLGALLDFFQTLLQQLQMWGYEYIVHGAETRQLAKVYLEMGSKPALEGSSVLVGKISELLKNLEEFRGRQ